MLGGGVLFIKAFFFSLFPSPPVSAIIVTMHALLLPFLSHTNLLLLYFHYFTCLHQKC